MNCPETIGRTGPAGTEITPHRTQQRARLIFMANLSLVGRNKSPGQRTWGRCEVMISFEPTRAGAGSNPTRNEIGRRNWINSENLECQRRQPIPPPDARRPTSGSEVFSRARYFGCGGSHRSVRWVAIGCASLDDWIVSTPALRRPMFVFTARAPRSFLQITASSVSLGRDSRPGILSREGHNGSKSVTLIF